MGNLYNPNVLGTQTLLDPMLDRNLGFWSAAEQEAICNTHAAIAGVGGDGFQLGLRLANMGVSRFTVADPEVFERENSNRVPGATVDTYGRNKAEVFREWVMKINPNAEVRVFNEGITEQNISDFLEGATISFDESELTHLELGTMLAREARRRKIPNVLVMNVGFAAQVTAFRPEGGMTFERLMGIPEDMPISEVRKQRLRLSRCIPYLPGYVDLASLRAVENGAPLPSIAAGVDMASAIGASQAFLHMTNGVNLRRPEPLWAPRIGYVDALTLKSGETSHPRLSHALSLGRMIARNLFGLNGKAGSYSEQERRQRKTAQASGVVA